MNISALCSSLLLLASVISCRRSAELKIAGRPSTHLHADITKIDTGWKLVTDLPSGKWRVKLTSDPFEATVVTIGSKSTAHWFATPERIKTGRPFFLELTGIDDPTIFIYLEIQSKCPGQDFSEGALWVVYKIIRPGITIKQ